MLQQKCLKTAAPIQTLQHLAPHSDWIGRIWPDCGWLRPSPTVTPSVLEPTWQSRVPKGDLPQQNGQSRSKRVAKRPLHQKRSGPYALHREGVTVEIVQRGPKSSLLLEGPWMSMVPKLPTMSLSKQSQASSSVANVASRSALQKGHWLRIFHF